MKKEIIISEANDLAVVFEDGRAAEFFLRSGDQLVGDIIWGQVEAVVPGIEAAFVNIGQDRNGFIHVADLPSAQTPRKQAAPKRPSIRVRERILVQIAKAPTGSKGARLTGRLTIPGRFLVLVPHDNRVSISRRITETAERDRLRRLTLKLKDPGHGLIVRTEAIGRSEEDLRQDIEELIDIWADILHQVQIVNPPALLHRDSDLIHRVLRDATTGDVAKVVVDTAAGYQKAREILKGWMPELERHVIQHKGPHSIMQRYRISEELEAAISPKVWLPSGGYLVIEHTEALTVIDVNSGRSTQSRSLADTVLKTNLEAAAEVARQLRLRDIGGIVVIDFISMDSAGDRNKVLQAFHEALKQDKSRPQVTNFSEHGLIEVSRRRQGQNLLEQLTAPCEACGGTGRVRVSHLLEQEGGERVAARAYDDEDAVIEELEESPYATEVVMADGSIEEESLEEGEGEGGGRRRRRRRGRGRGRGRNGEAGAPMGQMLTTTTPEGFLPEDEDEEGYLPPVMVPEQVPARRGRGEDRGRRGAAEPAARGGRAGRAPIEEEEVSLFEETFEEEGPLVEEVSLGGMFAAPVGAGRGEGRERGERGDRGERGGRDRGRGRDRERGGERGGERPFERGGDRDRGFDRGGERGDRGGRGERPFERGGERAGERDRGFDRGGERRDRGGFERDRERVFDRGPREQRPAAPAASAEPGAFTVSAPAPRTRRVERRGEAPAAAAPAPARPTPAPARPAAAPAPAPAAKAPAAKAPAAAPAAPAAKQPAASAKPAKAAPKPRTEPLPIPEQVEQIGVPGLFVLKKKPAAAAPAAEAKPAAKATKAAPKAAAEEPAEEKATAAKRRATPTRRATASKATTKEAEAPAEKPAAKAKAPAAKAATTKAPATKAAEKPAAKAPAAKAPAAKAPAKAAPAPKAAKPKAAEAEKPAKAAAPKKAAAPAAKKTTKK